MNREPTPSLVLCELADAGALGVESHSPFCLKAHRALRLDHFGDADLASGCAPRNEAGRDTPAPLDSRGAPFQIPREHLGGMDAANWNSIPGG